MKEPAIRDSPSGIKSRQQYAEAVSTDAKLTDFARKVGAELAKTLRRDGVAQTSITRIARKLETEPNVVGRAMGQLRARGYVDGERHPDGIGCLMPITALGVIDAWLEAA